MHKKVGDIMDEKFDHEQAIEKIKAALFDIYEDQEKQVGKIEDEQERNDYVKRYITIKDKALDLIKSISLIYGNQEGIEKNIENKTEEKGPVFIEKEQELESKDSEIEQKMVKLILDPRNGHKANFAYVPLLIFKKLKQNGTVDIKKLRQPKLYKIDSNKTRGIIVRDDQYMKLMLSKNRQKTVIKDAKNYRIEQARQSREKLVEEN